MLHVFRTALPRLALVFAIAFVALPAMAQVTIFSPFNIDGAVDPGVHKNANVAYADGSGKRLDIYRPDKQNGPAPVIMFIYGGGWAAGEKFEYDFVGRAFAAAGYVTVIGDYRKYPEVQYPDFLYDNAQIMKWIEDNIAGYGGDTSRFFLVGHSAGA